MDMIRRKLFVKLVVLVRHSSDNFQIEWVDEVNKNILTALFIVTEILN